jgi:UDP-glucose 4-epimerase
VKKIGVIGGAGFIGSHVVDALMAAGHEVTVFDIMKPHRDDVHHVYVDITSLGRTTVAITERFDAVYMLAAMADVNHVYINPVESIEVNVLAVANVLEACRRREVGRVILASTVWVYETALDTNPEEATPLATHEVRHLYTASKMSAELLCHSFQKLYGVNFTILRYGIPYGPRARGPTVVSTFFRKALAGEPLLLHGDGKQFRSFIYVSDLAAGNLAALSDAATNRVYNLEGPRPVSIREIAEGVRAIVGDQVKIEFAPPRPGDFAGKQLSNARVTAELGWKPKTDFMDGIRAYYDWLQTEGGAA